ncbi:unnamed protein product [Camellia sinensis]
MVATILASHNIAKEDKADAISHMNTIVNSTKGDPVLQSFEFREARVKMGSGGLDVKSTKHSCGSAVGVEKVSIDVVVEGVGGLGIRGGGTSSDGSSEVINSNNGDGGGVQIMCFTEVLEDVTLHFQIIRLHK